MYAWLKPCSQRTHLGTWGCKQFDIRNVYCILFLFGLTYWKPTMQTRIGRNQTLVNTTIALVWLVRRLEIPRAFLYLSSADTLVHIKGIQSWLTHLCLWLTSIFGSPRNPKKMCVPQRHSGEGESPTRRCGTFISRLGWSQGYQGNQLLGQVQ